MRGNPHNGRKCPAMTISLPPSSTSHLAHSARFQGGPDGHGLALTMQRSEPKCEGLRKQLSQRPDRTLTLSQLRRRRSHLTLTMCTKGKGRSARKRRHDSQVLVGFFESLDLDHHLLDNFETSVDREKHNKSEETTGSSFEIVLADSAHDMEELTKTSLG
jgi:hypothetical protein